MSIAAQEYKIEHLVQFLKEEFDRIIIQCGLARGQSLLSDARALSIWFLHQEIGISYEEANHCVLDDTNDCGVDFIRIDSESKRVIVGQTEYDTTRWIKEPATEKKATETFDQFCRYLTNGSLPQGLHPQARAAWQAAKTFLSKDGYTARYIFVTPKDFGIPQRERIRHNAKLEEYEFFTNEELLQRGEEFLNGQTGMSSFRLPFKKQPLNLAFDFGQVFVTPVGLKEIHNIIASHEKQKKLLSLFTSNVRSQLTSKKRSKEIGKDIQNTIQQEPDHFLIYNNGITIQCSNATLNADNIYLERASISNGCQTVMNIHEYFQRNEGADPNAEVLVTVIELKKDAANIASEIAIARNNQNPVDNRDLKSNHPLMVTLHHQLFAELGKLGKRYYLLRKQGEKLTVVKGDPNAKWSYLWMDADVFARRIAAVLRRDPSLSQKGTNEIFGKFFSNIFPAINEPSHKRCIYAFWLVEMIECSYAGKTGKSRWKGVSDPLINRQKDFKKDAKWTVAAMIADRLKADFNFAESLEQRFVEYCEKWRVSRGGPAVESFEAITFEMIDRAFRLLHATTRPLLGKRLPKSKGSYTQYDDLFKGPNYPYIRLLLSKGIKINYQKKLRGEMNELVEFLKQG